MLRTALLRSFQGASKATTAVQTPMLRQLAARQALLPAARFVPRPSSVFQSARQYSAAAALTKEEVQGRILDLLKTFDKIKDASKVSEASHFTNDLGLDSLDTVEVVMAIEEEFSIEIPDAKADAIQTVDQAVSYVVEQPDAH